METYLNNELFAFVNILLHEYFEYSLKQLLLEHAYVPIVQCIPFIDLKTPPSLLFNTWYNLINLKVLK